MAGQPRRRRARRLVSQMIILLRETRRPWTIEELLTAVGYGGEHRPYMSRVGRAAANMAARDLHRHPHVAADEHGRVVYWRSESNGHAGLEETPAP